MLKDFRNSIAAVPEVAAFYRCVPHACLYCMLVQIVVQVQDVLLFTLCQSDCDRPWHLNSSMCSTAKMCAMLRHNTNH